MDGHTPLTEEDLAVLEWQDTETLARWYSTLNRWKWPDDFPTLEVVPKGFGIMSLEEAMPRRQYAMAYIVAKIGQKECLRYHHIHDLNRSPEEFEDWWGEHGQNVDSPTEGQLEALRDIDSEGEK